MCNCSELYTAILTGIKAFTKIYEVCSNSKRIGIAVVVHWVGCVCMCLDMFVRVLATHDTSCKWLRLFSWLQ